MEAQAESVESLASLGRTYRAVFVLNSDWRLARSLKSPCIAQRESSRGSRSIRSSPRRRWTDKPLTITVAADAAEDERTSRLLHLARYDELDIAACQEPVAETYARVSLLRYDDTRDDGFAVLTHDRYPETQHQDIVDFLPSAVDEIGGPHARDIALAWFAHRTLERDLLVTTNEFLLEHREKRAWLEGRGITTPEEATHIAEAFLRFHGQFNVHVSGGGSGSVSTGLFYNAVAMASLPRAVEAMRSCLAPSNRTRQRTTADHLESIIHRFHDLAIAQDRLASLAQEEGFLGASNDLLAEQLYHLQNSIVLFTGALDVLAWVVADLGTTNAPSAGSVSWVHLVNADHPWVRNLADPRANALARAARNAPHTPLTSLIFQLRHTYQHRRPLEGVVVSFEERDQLVRAHIGLVDVTQVPGVGHDVVGVPGVVALRERTFLVPDRFQRAAMAHGAAVVNHVLAAGAWPDWNWLDQTDWTNEVQQQAALEAAALHQFGTLSGS
jgi:hypothetical protein